MDNPSLPFARRREIACNILIANALQHTSNVGVGFIPTLAATGNLL